MMYTKTAIVILFAISSIGVGVSLADLVFSSERDGLDYFFLLLNGVTSCLWGWMLWDFTRHTNE